MADIAVTVRDETTSGELLGELELQLTQEDVDVAELIRARVHQEVRTHNAAPHTRFAGLVMPSDDAPRRNQAPAQRRIDPARQTKVAHDAFARGQVLILVDERQLTELDEHVVLRSDSSVTFLKLVPLVGG